MRRLALPIALAATAAAPAAAQAHTLGLEAARAQVAQYAEDLAVRTGMTRQPASVVTGCARVNQHVVRCSFFTLSQPEPPLNGTMRCDDAVEVYYATERSYVAQTRPVGLPSCEVG